MAINLGPVKDYVAGYATALAGMFGIKTAGGWRKTDQFPDHPSGHAVDFMITDIGPGGVASKNPAGKAAGDQLAAYAVANANALGVKYVIWNRQVWNPRQGWHPYTQAGQGPHDDHVHITWNDAPGTISPNGLTGVRGLLMNTAYGGTQQVGNPLTDSAKDAVKDAGTIVTKLAFASLGLTLIAAGLWTGVSPKVGQALKSVPGLSSLT